MNDQSEATKWIGQAVERLEEPLQAAIQVGDGIVVDVGGHEDIARDEARLAEQAPTREGLEVVPG